MFTYQARCSSRIPLTEQVLTIEDLQRLPLETIAIYLCLKAMATLILVIKLYLQL